MQNRDEVSRRQFLGRVGAGAVLGAAGIGVGSHLGAQTSKTAPGRRTSASSSWTPPPTLSSPNILVIMVDQMRLPMWMSAEQTAVFNQTVMPNVMGRLQSTSYTFGQYFCTACNCTPARAGLLTGLYAPQTGVYATDSTQTVPALLTAFPTFGQAMAALNPAYQGNVWWFGKWHLSSALVANPLLPYGFNTRTYPGGPGPNYNPSPNGGPNEGSNGGTCTVPGPNEGQVWASDAQIAGDFLGWLEGQAPTTGAPSSPWCATVSLINPHDISEAPAFMQSHPFPPTDVPEHFLYFSPPPGNPPSFYSEQPANWNWEDLSTVPNKPGIQLTYQKSLAASLGPVNSWVQFLNNYMWLHNFVDQQVGLVLDALYSSPYANNTIVIFMADHGEFGGSHGLHDKGGATYDEALRVPLSVQFPGQTGQIAMNQMGSAVDFFGLMCDLATGGSAQWRLAYPDLANRQSLWSFLYNNSSETRIAPAPLGLPYILHTFDEIHPVEDVPYVAKGKSHIVCLRSKVDAAQGVYGGKLAFYYEWPSCSVYPNSTPPDPEFYDYTNNTSELGNDYYSQDHAVEQSLANHVSALGGWGPPSTGIIGTELNAPLVGTGNDGNPLSEAQSTAQQLFVTYVNGGITCP